VDDPTRLRDKPRAEALMPLEISSMPRRMPRLIAAEAGKLDMTMNPTISDAAPEMRTATLNSDL